MMELLLTLNNDDGLHARPAGVLAKAASQYTARIEIEAKGVSKNAKSVMSLLTLGLEKGDQIKLKVDGPEAELALNELKALIAVNFGN